MARLLGCLLVVGATAGCVSEPRRCEGARPTDDTCPAGETCLFGRCRPLRTSCGLINHCGERRCGPDPVCGFSCGPPCPYGYECRDGACLLAPTECPRDRDCYDRECGPDPRCGRSCGECSTGERCRGGRCVAERTATGDFDLGARTGRLVAIGNTRGMPDQFRGSCDGGRGPRVGEAVYRFVAPADDQYMIDTEGSLHPDTVLYVLDAEGRELVCNDDEYFFDWYSRLVLPLRAGQAVRIVVDGFSRETDRPPAVGGYVLNITRPRAVEYCTPEGATTVRAFSVLPRRFSMSPFSVNGSPAHPIVSGTVFGALDGPFPPSCARSGSSVAFHWTADRWGGTYLFQNPGGVLHARVLECGSSPRDERPCALAAPDHGGVSRLVVRLRPGQSLPLAVGVHPRATGADGFTLEVVGPARCGNDSCDDWAGESAADCPRDCR